MSYAYRQAYTEVYYILQNMSEVDVRKIPPDIIEILKQNRLKNYEVSINPSIPLKEQNLKEETKAVLAVLYRKFWCDEDKKEELERKFYEKLKYETEIKAKSIKKPKEEYKGIDYSPKVIRDENQKEVKTITEYKIEKWYNKLFNRIRKILKKDY